MKAIFLAFLSVAGASAAISVKPETTVPSPQPVGSVIGLIARLQVTGPPIYNYRSTVSTAGGPFRLVRSGFINPGASIFATVYSSTVETSADGKLVYRQQVDGAWTYRSFRVSRHVHRAAQVMELLGGL
jgi:hypothetical protein